MIDKWLLLEAAKKTQGGVGVRERWNGETERVREREKKNT